MRFLGFRQKLSQLDGATGRSSSHLKREELYTAVGFSTASNMAVEGSMTTEITQQ
jgi:hypothetical protein